MFLTVFQIFGVPAHGTGDIDVEEVYKILDSDKEEERKKSILTDSKAKEMADSIISKTKNMGVLDKIHQEISEKKTKKIFDFGVWGWKKGF